MRPKNHLNDETLHHIVVVGGGAAGLELVTRLGERLGRRGRARVTLVECAASILVNTSSTTSPRPIGTGSATGAAR